MLACVEVSIKDVLPCEAASDDMLGKRSLRAEVGLSRVICISNDLAQISSRFKRSRGASEA